MISPRVPCRGQAVGGESWTYPILQYTGVWPFFFISDALQNFKLKRLLVATLRSVSRNISVNSVNGCGTDYRGSIPARGKDPSICSHISFTFWAHPALNCKDYANVCGHYGVLSSWSVLGHVSFCSYLGVENLTVGSKYIMADRHTDIAISVQWSGFFPSFLILLWLVKQILAIILL